MIRPRMGMRWNSTTASDSLELQCIRPRMGMRWNKACLLSLGDWQSIRPRMGMRWNRNILCILDFINHYTDFTSLNNVIIRRISYRFYHQYIKSLREPPVCAVFFTQRSDRFAQFIISIYLFYFLRFVFHYNPPSFMSSINSSVCKRITDYFY